MLFANVSQQLFEHVCRPLPPDSPEIATSLQKRGLFLATVSEKVAEMSDNVSRYYSLDHVILKLPRHTEVWKQSKSNALQ